MVVMLKERVLFGNREFEKSVTAGQASGSLERPLPVTLLIRKNIQPNYYEKRVSKS